MKKTFKIFSFKKYFSKLLIGVLLYLNLVTYQFTRNYFHSHKENKVTVENPIYSYLYSGWQVIDWTLSIVDYIKHIGDKKQYLYNQNKQIDEQRQGEKPVTNHT